MWLPGEIIPTLMANVENPVGIEIGVLHGETTAFLMETMPNLVLYGIDPYAEYKDWDGNIVHENDFVYRSMEARTSKYDNFTHLRMTSDDAVNMFEDESMDFVFVDGDHSYSQVKKDLANWYPKVRKGGLFCGHDYSAIMDVKLAVDEFIKTQNMEDGFVMQHHPEQDMWYWFKK
jgi:predicted O-methyltransferase YrrM